jgi:hypothetical protein
MECHDARLLLTLHRREPDQLDGPELDALERHIELCPDCQNWNRSEACFDTAVTAALTNVTVPANLRDRINQRLAASKPPRRGAWVAAAAAFFFVVGASGLYFGTRPEELSLEQVATSLNEIRSVGPGSVQEYFTELGYSMTPPDFDFEFLQEYKLTSFRGRMVPTLMFQSRSGNATVYCLPKSRFRLPEDASGSATLQVIDGETDIYVIDYSGGAHWLRPRQSY